MKVGDNIGRVLLIEFRDQDMSAFNEIMEILKKHQEFEYINLKEISVLSLPGLWIYLERRKVYCDSGQIELTTKEFDILCLLASAKDRVLTYDQIYENLWKEEAFGNVNSTVGCHIRNLRRKLKKAIPNAKFSIRCTRNIGYCIEVKKANT